MTVPFSLSGWGLTVPRTHMAMAAVTAASGPTSRSVALKAVDITQRRVM